jgi:hypothetical protein
MPKKRGSLHDGLAARGEQYNQPAALSFNLDFGSELLRVKGFASRGAGVNQRTCFYVYLLHSISDNGFYIGYSTDLKRRLSEHKQGFGCNKTPRPVEAHLLRTLR